MDISKTDCRTEEGIIVGLIDAIISIARVAAPKIKKMGKDEFTEPVLYALQDLTNDEDVLSILRAVNSRFIISEEGAMILEATIANAVAECKKKPIKL